MSTLVEFIDKADADLGALFTRQTGKPIKDAFIALAMFDSSLLGGWGSTFTNAASATVTLSGSTIADVVTELAIASKAYFFGNPSITGKQAKTTPKKYGQKYGTQEIEQETGERVGTVEIMFRDYLRNIPFFNTLFDANPNMDFVLFTNATAIWIRATENSPVVHSGGYELGGNADTTAGPGTFTITYYMENGDLEHMEGVSIAKISADRAKFTFGDATSLSVNLAAESASNGRQRFKRTGSAATANFTKVVAQTAAAFVTYTVKGISANAITNIAKVTVNPTTGVITVASDLATGTYEFQVIAQNTTGVFGTYSFTLIIA